MTVNPLLYPVKGFARIAIVPVQVLPPGKSIPVIFRRQPISFEPRLVIRSCQPCCPGLCPVIFIRHLKAFPCFCLRHVAELLQATFNVLNILRPTPVYHRMLMRLLVVAYDCNYFFSQYITGKMPCQAVLVTFTQLDSQSTYSILSSHWSFAGRRRARRYLSCWQIN